MAGAKVNNYAIGDSDIEAVMLTTDQIYKGQCHVTLTEMSTTTVPKIAAGSWIENNGTLFKFDSDETLTGSPSDGIVYIRIVPSTTTCTAEMTNTAPTWSDSKQGWYGTGGAANYRYVDGIWMKKSTSSYYKYTETHKLRFVNLACGTMNIWGGSNSGGTYNENSFLSKEIDALSEISGTTFTASIGGMYEISWTASIGVACTSSMLKCGTRLYLNGSQYNSAKYTRSGAIGTYHQSVQSNKIIVPLASGDSISINQFFGNGGSYVMTFEIEPGNFYIRMI